MEKREITKQLPTEIVINGQALSNTEVLAVARHFSRVTLGGESIASMQAARALIDTIVEDERKVYGVTTGFGHLSSVRIPHDQVVELQHNLLRSHSAGVGEPLSEEVVRAMMLLAGRQPGTRAFGRASRSGRDAVGACSISAFARSFPPGDRLGASGDLAPLAHLGLVLIGEGEALYDGQKLSGNEALQRAGIKPTPFARQRRTGTD